MGNPNKDKSKDQDREAAAESITSPGMPTTPTGREKPEEKSMGHHPSQDNCRSSSKGDGKGSCALPSLTQ